MKSYAISFFPYTEEKFKATWFIRGVESKLHAIRSLKKKRKIQGEHDVFITSIKEIGRGAENV